LSIILASSTIVLAKASIGKNVDEIVFDANSTSKTFKVWNRGSGTLYYYFFVIHGSAYFHVTPASGISTHGVVGVCTVIADFNKIPHGETVTAQIKIVDAADVNSPQYIDLTAQNVISRHVQFIKIEEAIDYIPGASDEKAVTGNCDGLGLAGDFDCDGHIDLLDFAVFAEQWRQTGSDIRADISPSYKDGSVDPNDLKAFSKNWLKDGRIGETYDFRFAIETDSTVADVNFTTPDGFTYPDSNHDASRHIGTTHTTQNGITSWKYQEWFYEANGLDYYPDGKYTVKVIYTDNNSEETIVGFGIPKEAGSIARPTQRPELTNPLNTEGVASPLQSAWEKCSDSNVNSIRLGFDNPSDSNLTEQDYGENAVKADALNLDPGKWFAQLGFGRWYQAQNDNDITIEVGKTSRSHIAFDITKGFGTFGELKNHQLQAPDCAGKMVTFSLTGGGSAVVESDSNVQGDCSFANIILTGTTDKSVLTITPEPGAKTSIGSIDVKGPIKTINARNVNLNGDIIIDGNAAMILLNDVSGSSNIKIGHSSSPKATCSLKFGRVNNLVLTSGMPIKELRATEWKSGSVNAPWISNLAIDGNAAGGVAGDFGADVNLRGGNPKGVSLNKAKIMGELGDSNWIVVGNCGTIETASSSQGLDANITGNIGTLKAVGNKTLSIDARLSGMWQVKSVNTLITGQLADSNFTATAASGLLKTLKITGVVGEPFGIINSNVKVDHFGIAYLAFPKYSNNGTPFGLTAKKIDKITVKDPAKTWTRTKLVGAETITTEDFVIRLQ
jgi:hypothetical protein